MGTQLILPNFVLPGRISQVDQYSGIDSLDHCCDRDHFKSYPHAIEYRYNSRGYRDQEWPNDLNNAIWCLGDSFTAGIGSPIEHTWPYLLQQVSGQTCINISMDGASNDWLARRALDITTKVPSQRLVIMWSFIERRELAVSTVAQDIWQNFYQAIRDKSWPHQANFGDLPTTIKKEIIQEHHNPSIEFIGDDIVFKIEDNDRIYQDHQASDRENIENFANNIQQVAKACPNAIHAFVPGFCRQDLATQCQAVMPDRCLAITPKLDLARDGYHFDIKTAQWIVQAIQNLL